jgi:hypothetical protein
MKLDELDHDMLGKIQSMLFPTDSSNLHLVSKKIHENLDEKYVSYRKEIDEDVKFFNISQNEKLFILVGNLTEEIINSIAEIAGNFTIYPSKITNEHYIKFDSNIKNVQDFYKINLIIQIKKVFEFNRSLILEKDDERLFSGKCIKDKNLYTIPDIYYNIDEYKGLVTDHEDAIENAEKYEYVFSKDMMQIYSDDHALEYKNNFGDVKNLYYILMVNGTEVDIILFNKNFIICLDLDKIKVRNHFTLKNVKEIKVVNSLFDLYEGGEFISHENDSFRLITIGENKKILDIFSLYGDEELIVKDDRYFSDKYYLENKLLIDIIDEKVYDNDDDDTGIVVQAKRIL